MRRKSGEAERLLILTLTLESAIEAENWTEVAQLLSSRAELIDSLPEISHQAATEIAQSEERSLTLLRERLRGVKSDLRNLSAALRIAAPYVRAAPSAAFSIAG